LATAAVLRAILLLIASISETTRSGTEYCTMWPTPGSTISLPLGTVVASGREWMLVDTVLSASPVMMVIGVLISPHRLLGHR
jgi:hypothetical protein